MTWVSFLAIYFILWWVTLFAMLPFGLRTQDEDDDVTLGTTASAPRGAHMLRAVIRTTIVSLALFGLFYLVIVGFDLGIDDIPRLAPRFD